MMILRRDLNKNSWTKLHLVPLVGSVTPESCGGSGAGSRAVYVHLLPGVVDALPDACFAATCGDRFTVLKCLGEPRVAQYNGLITEPAQMGTRHGDCHRCGCCVWIAGQVEVIAVKGQPFHQVTHTFSLKTADICVAHLAVVLPVPRRNTFQHGLVDGEDLSIAFLKGHAICCGYSL